MAEEVARLVAVVEANLKGFTKGMEDMQKIADRRFGALEKSIKKTESAFGVGFNRGINLLATRFLGLSAAISVLNRIASEAAKNNDEVKASVERMNDAYARLGESAAPGIAFVNNRLADMLEAVNNVITGLKNAGAEFRASPLLGGIGGTVRTQGVPFASAATPFARIDPTTKNVIPGAAGFPVPGVTDITPKKPPGGKTIAEREAELTIETFNKVADAVREIQEKRAKEDAEFRAKQFEAQREQQNAAKAEELDALDQFHADALEAEDRYWESIIEMGQRADELKKERVAERIRAIGDGFEYLGRAALAGGDAFSRALQSMAADLALSGLRSLFESILTSQVGAGGIIGSLISPRASGGPVHAGGAYLVGERGPELFSPNTSGNIIPHIPAAMAGGAPGAITLNMPIDARGAQEGVAEQIAKVAPSIVAAAVKQVSRNFGAMSVKYSRSAG